MAVGGHCVQGCLNVLPTTLVVQRATDRLRDESTAPSPADAAVELGDDIVGENYVQTHGHKLTHTVRVATGQAS